jgi:small-conductance mechanosensitive channel
MAGGHPWLLVALFVTTVTPAVHGQQPSASLPPDRFAAAVASAAATAQPAPEPAPLVFANRRILTLRATVMSRAPDARAAAAIELLQRLVDESPTARASTRTYTEATVVSLGEQPVFVIFAADIDPLQGEDLAGTALAAAARLQLAFDESVELHSGRRLASAGGIALAATILYVLAIWVVVRVERRVATYVSRRAEERLRSFSGSDAFVDVSGARTSVHLVFTVVSWVLGGLLTYAWLTIVMRRFPYTRPWGESLRGVLFSTAASAARALIDALPNAVTVLAIVVVIRLLARLVTKTFDAVEQGRLTLPWVYPDTAASTRRIAVTLLWLCALIVSYPYLPGSQSEVFKGVSVFVGLIVSLGSSGVMNQAMSGLMVTYSRSLKSGEYVRLGDIEGTVTSVGTLATKIRSPLNEEITIPNATVASQATTNFSRRAAEGTYSHTSVTIGYDTPWRQVHAMLLIAAKRTAGVRSEPAPVILQMGLEDWYVKYTLFVALEEPHRRFFVLDVLHANIQDAFNEHGVQIMSPRYVMDPRAPKVVPPEHWYASPASPHDAIGTPHSAVSAAETAVGP